MTLASVTVRIETAAGRDAFLARAESSLARGECLVRIVDVVGLRRSVRTTPRDPRAELVAREVPVVLRGGLTSVVSYHRVPIDALGATETHYAGDQVSHTYDVLLQVARVGTREATVAPRTLPA
jgi:hypothetical protein